MLTLHTVSPIKNTRKRTQTRILIITIVQYVEYVINVVLFFYLSKRTAFDVNINYEYTHTIYKRL